MIPQVGDRVRMTGLMPNDPCSMNIGDEGSVTEVSPEVGQIYVEWDNKRSLILLTTDPFIVVKP